MPKDNFITTADFTALYSNINHTYCLSLLTDFFNDFKFENNEPESNNFCFYL